MRTISDTAGSSSYLEAYGEDRDIAVPSTGKKFYQDLIKKADSVPIIRLFKHYGLRLDEQTRKTTCPFLTHQGGRERSSSFYYYPQTNSFWCFGCKTGVRCCDLVSNLDKISKVKAAYKILEMFNVDADDDAVLIDRENFSEKLEIMLSFSNVIRNFRRSNNDEKSTTFIENICMVYDAVNAKHHLNNEALRSVVDQLKNKINSYIL